MDHRWPCDYHKADKTERQWRCTIRLKRWHDIFSRVLVELSTAPHGMSSDGVGRPSLWSALSNLFLAYYWPWRSCIGNWDSPASAIYLVSLCFMTLFVKLPHRIYPVFGMLVSRFLRVCFIRPSVASRFCGSQNGNLFWLLFTFMGIERGFWFAAQKSSGSSRWVSFPAFHSTIFGPDSYPINLERMIREH
jgi:hypothetical protein